MTLKAISKNLGRAYRDEKGLDKGKGAQQREPHTMKANDAKNESDGQGAWRRECRGMTQNDLRNELMLMLMMLILMRYREIGIMKDYIEKVTVNAK